MHYLTIFPKLRQIFLIAVIGVWCTPIFAVDYSWTGASSNTWSASGNWSGGIPANASTTAVYFGAPSSGRVSPSITSSVTVGSLTFNLGASAYTISRTSSNTLTLTAGGSVNNNSTSLETFSTAIVLGGSSTWNTANGGVTVSGVMSGAGSSITKTGTGTLILSGANTYTGGTTISTGTLQVNTNGNLGTGGVLNNAVLSYNSTGTITEANAISGSGRLNQIGTGTTILTGSNTYQGGTTISAGALQFSSINNLGMGTVVLNGGALRWATGNTADVSGSITLGGGAVDTNDNNITFATALGGSGPLIKAGTGTLTLSTAPTSVTSVIVSGGTLRSGAAGVLPSGVAYTINGTATGGAATLDLNGNGLSIGALTLGGSTSGANAVNTVTTGGATLTLGGTVTYVIASSSSKDPGTASITGSVNFGSGTRTFNIADSSKTTVELNIGADLTGTGGLTKTGAGVLVLAGANSYSGNTVISAGVLRGNLPGTSNLQLNGGVFELTNDLSIGSGTGAGQLQWTSGGFSAFGGNHTVDIQDGGGSSVTLLWNGSNFIASGASLALSSVSSDSTITLDNNIDLNGVQQTVVTNNGSAAIDAVLSGVLSDGGVTVSGAGVLSLAGLSTYTGTTVISSGSTLSVTKLANVGSASSIGAGSNIATNLQLTNSTLRYTGTGDSTDRLLSIGAGSGTLAYLDASGSGALVFSNTGTLGFITASQTRTLDLEGSSTADNTFNIQIVNNGTKATNVYKDGSGKWVLSGANTYTGTTYVAAGTLSVTNNLSLGGTASSSNTTVTDGATLNLNNVSISEPLDLEGAGAGGVGVLTGTGVSTASGTITLEDNASFGGTGSLTVGYIRTIYSGTVLTKVGSGTLILGGGDANDIEGTVVASGTLVLNKTLPGPQGAYQWAIEGYNAAINSGATMQIAGNTGDEIGYMTTVQVDTGGVFDFNGRNETIGGLTGTGTVTNSASALGVIQIGSNISYEGLGLGINTTFSGLLQDGVGKLALTKAGTTTFTLSSANTYSGGTTVNNGTLLLTNGAALGSVTGSTTVNSGATLGVVNTNVNAQTITLKGTGYLSAGALTSTGTSSLAGNVILGSNATISVTGSLAINGNVSGNHTLFKIGTGTLTLSGSNSQTENDINGGILQVTSAGGLGSSSGYTRAYTGGTLSINNVALNAQNYTFVGTGAGGIGALVSTGNSSLSGSVGAFGDFTVGVTGSLTINAGISASNVMTKIGTGSLILSGAADNSALTVVVSAGTLVLAKDSSEDVHSAGYGLTVNSGATAQLAGTGGDQIFGGATVQIDGTLDFNGRNESFQTLSGTGLLTNTAASTVSTFTIGENDADSTFDGTIQDGAGVLALNKVGGGAFTLNGNNTYTGGTTLSGGVVVLGSAGALGSSGAITFAGGTLQFTSANTTDYSSRFSTADNQQFIFDTNGQNVTIANSLISSGGSLVKTGDGKLTLSAANSYDGTTTVAQGTLSATNNAAFGSTTGEIDIWDGATLDLNNVNVTAGSVYVNGTGVGGNGALTSSGTSSLSGYVELDSDSIFNVAGSLTMNGEVQSGSTLTKIGAGTLTFAGTDDNDSLSVVVSSGTIVLAKASSGGAHAIGLGLTVNNGATAQLAGTGGDQIYSGAAVQIDGTLDFNGRDESLQTLIGIGVLTNSAAATTSTFTIGENDNDSDFAGSIRNGAGVMALNKVGDGTFTLEGTNTYSGGTVINSGTVQVGAGSTTGSLGSGGITNHGALVYNRSNTITESNVIDGEGTLTQGGNGVLILTAANTYTGATTVNSGTLQVDGSIVNSATTVNGGTLQGKGTLGDVTVNAGGTLMAGDNATLATITVGALIFNDSTTLQFKLDSSLSHSDTIAVTGQLALDNTQLLFVDLASIPQVLTEGTTLTLITYSDGMAVGLGTGTDLFFYNGQALTEGSTFTAGANTFRINYAVGDPSVTVTTVAVPEPGALFMLALGLGLLAFMQSRKQRV